MRHWVVSSSQGPTFTDATRVSRWPLKKQSHWLSCYGFGYKIQALDTSLLPLFSHCWWSSSLLPLVDTADICFRLSAAFDQHVCAIHVGTSAAQETRAFLVLAALTGQRVPVHRFRCVVSSSREALPRQRPSRTCAAISRE